MHWRETYRRKLASPEEALRRVESGQEDLRFEAKRRHG
jgi:hypothetical protein